MVLHGIEIKRWDGLPSHLLVVSINGTATWCNGYENAAAIRDDAERDTGETAYIYAVKFESVG